MPKVTSRFDRKSTAKTVFVHIGFHKTGTSALQECLFRNRGVLQKHGIYYPDPLCSHPAHQELAYSIIPKQLAWADGEYDRTDVYEHYCKVFRDVPEGAAVIVSSEELCRLDSQPVCLDLIRQAWQEFDLRIVAYVRNPVDFLISLFHHALKTSPFSGSFEQYLRSRNYKSITDFDRRLAEWRRVFGSGNVLVRDYDRILDGPQKKDIVADLFEVIGRPAPVEVKSDRINSGIHPWMVDAYTRVKDAGVDSDRTRALLARIERLSRDMPKVDAAEFYLGVTAATELRKKLGVPLHP